MQALLESSQTFYARDNNTTLSTICHQDIRNDPPEENNQQSIIDKNNVTLCLIIEVQKYPCLWNHSFNEWKDTPKKKELWSRLAKKLKFRDICN